MVFDLVPILKLQHFGNMPHWFCNLKIWATPVEKSFIRPCEGITNTLISFRENMYDSTSLPGHSLSLRPHSFLHAFALGHCSPLPLEMSGGKYPWRFFVQNGSDWWHPIRYVWPRPIILHGCTCWIVSKIPHLPVPFLFLYSAAEMPQYECYF